MDPDEASLGPAQLEVGDRLADQVAAGLGDESRVVALRLDPANVVAMDDAGDVPDTDRDALVGDRLRLFGRLSTGDDAPDGAVQPLAADRLEDEVDGGEVERLDGAGLVCGDEHDRRRLGEPRHGARQVEPRQPGHVDVEERGVDLMLCEQANRFGTGGCPPDPPDARITPQELFQLVEHGSLVVGDEHVDRRGAGVGS
jgi:hypothetical protein